MMKKVLMLNGSPHEKGCTYTALRELERALQKHGIGTEIHWLGKAPVAGCIACGRCGETGRCVFEDGVNALLPRLDEFGALVAASPVYYAGASGQLTAFLDRLFYAGGARMAGKIAAVNMEMEAFYDKAKDADYIIYIWSLGGKPETLADFLAKSEVFADFKAVKEGNVWCTTPDYFQISNTLGSMIRDMHLMIDADKDTDSLTYLNRLK